MPKYRLMPKYNPRRDAEGIIEGFRHGLQQAYPWFAQAIKDGVVFSDSKITPKTGDIYIKTPFGTHTVHKGDYVYRFSSGDIRSLPPKLFEMRFEEVR